MAPQSRFEIISAGGDVAVVIHGRSLAEMVDCVCLAYAALIVEGGKDVRARSTRTVIVRHDGDAALGDTLVRFLNELVYLSDTEGFIPTGAVLRKGGRPGEIEIAVRGERYDPVRHPQGLLVKAATYHGLDVRRTDAGFAVRILLDL